MSLLINSIYLGTEGEGIFVGTPQVFVRLQGCAIGCRNCDSKDTWRFNQKQKRAFPGILNEIKEQGLGGKIKRVSITGGDPLDLFHVPGVLGLIGQLKALGYFVHLEAAGDKIVHKIFDLLDFVSFDYKTSSTGVQGNVQNLLMMAKQYPLQFQIKSVVETHKDFAEALKAYNAVLKERKKVDFTWCLTPCYKTGEKFPQKRFQSIIEWNHLAGAPFRVIGQQHKWIFGSFEKRV